jgi:cold-inducible RNA-binding protein
MNIYVGNLGYDVTDNELQAAFEAYGEVDSAKVIMDRDTGRSKGFGFVEMPEKEEALKAIEGLNETELGGRKISVNEARPKPKRDSRGGFGGGGRGGGYGGGRGGSSGGGRNRY